MIPVREMSVDELGAYVQTHLRKHNIQVVLSGGACVSIYSHGAYVSHDLDMVILYSARRQAIHAAMAMIGFDEIGRHYVNPETQFLIEFPPGPLSIGAEPVQRVDEIELRTGTLRIISPTDCVRIGWLHTTIGETGSVYTRQSWSPVQMQLTLKKF